MAAAKIQAVKGFRVVIFPIFDHIMGRFGIWVWTAAIISVFSKTALFAVVRSFVFSVKYHSVKKIIKGREEIKFV